MDSKGQIHNLSDEYLASISQKEKDALVPIPEDKLAAIEALPRRERRAWYAQQRRLLRKGTKAQRENYEAWKKSLDAEKA